MNVAIAASSQLAADAGAAVAEAGGNAVDAAIAAALVSANTEPGVCALAGGGYVTIWPPDRPPETLDGQVRMPGAGLAPERLGGGAVAVDMAYGGGVTTLVDAGSVGVPGALAALETAWRRHGRIAWRQLFEPVTHVTQRGFPLPVACHHYLGYSAHPVFSRSPEGHAALHDDSGQLLPPGSPVVVPGLADSLALIGEEGAEAFYRGPLAEAMVAHVQARGGMLTHDDLANCQAIVRPALTLRVGDWQIATNPPPAVGGVMLAAMLLAAGWPLPAGADAGVTARLAAIQHWALDFRRTRLHGAQDTGPALTELLAGVQAHGKAALASPSTIHVSATDRAGLCCAVTLSAGYGSGLIPPGTGLWLNNCLGELELNSRGLVFGPPGTPVPSNMAPTCARHAGDGAALAIGSPGADRITTALFQVLLRFLGGQLPLAAAIAAPRLHLEYRDDRWQAAVEPGLDTRRLDLPVRAFDALSMFFGGVGATLRDAEGALVAAADPRRAGGTRVTSHG
ncbi:MAG: gamma-glutamyltransferase [Gammaproteobacteria bacterium]|nr:MAG: gamma-glutamyltransferase [Gammaproteobacteria bacterium]